MAGYSILERGKKRIRMFWWKTLKKKTAWRIKCGVEDGKEVN
jgi:hypothetical protein